MAYIGTSAVRDATSIADGTIVNADINASAAIATSKITGLATSATTDTTNASNIATGTLPNARIASLPVSTLAGIGTSGEVLTSNGTGSAPTMQAAAGGGIILSGRSGGDGASTSGGKETHLNSTGTFDLSGHTGKTLFATVSTCMNENSNHSDNIHLGVKIHYGSSDGWIGRSRAYSIGTNLTYGQPVWPITALGVITITSAMATSGVYLKLMGGVEGGGAAFTYGDAYSTTGDGEQSGWSITWFVA